MIRALLLLAALAACTPPSAAPPAPWVMVGVLEDAVTDAGAHMKAVRARIRDRIFEHADHHPRRRRSSGRRRTRGKRCEQKQSTDHEISWKVSAPASARRGCG